MIKIVQAGQTFVLSGTLASSGTLIGSAGTFGASHGADIAVRSHATNDGTIGLFAGAGYYGAYQPTGATLSVTGVLTNNGLINAAGGDYSYRGNGVKGASIIDRGTLVNAGTITLGGAEPAGEETGGGTGAVLLDQGMLINSGMLTIQAGDYGYAGASGGTAAVSGLLTNTGTIQVLGVHTYYSPGSGGVFDLLATGTLHNTGVLSVYGGYKASSGTISVAGVLFNSGTINVGDPHQYEPSATLDIAQGGTLENTQQLYVWGSVERSAAPHEAAAGLLDAGVLTNSFGIELFGGYAGGYATHDGATGMVTGTLDNTGRLSVFGGEGALLPGGYAGTGATLVNAGTLSNAGELYIGAGEGALGGSVAGSGGLVVDNGRLANSGNIYIQGTDAYSGNGYPSSATLLVTGVLVNSGSIDVNAFGFAPPATSVGGVLIDSGQLNNIGSISLDLAGNGSVGTMTVTAAGALTDSGTISGGGKLVNEGIIGSGKGATAGIIDVAALTNDGTINVSPAGAFVVDSTVTSGAGQYGIFNLTHLATLTLGDAISASQTVSFLGNHATLALGNAVTFAGTLDGLGATDTIDFQASMVVSATTSGLVLEIGLAGGTTLDLALGAPLTGVTFSLATDGNGGTDVELRPASGTAAIIPPSTNHPSMDLGFNSRSASDLHSAMHLHGSRA